MGLKLRRIGTASSVLMFMASLTVLENGNAAGTAPTDPQIVGVVVAANQIDIDAGRLALKKAKSQQVREFAQQMITDHGALQKSVFALGAKLNVKPEESDTSRSLKSQAEE